MSLTWWVSVANMLAGIANLVAYAWGSHDPASLAVGIANLAIANFIKD